VATPFNFQVNVLNSSGTIDTSSQALVTIALGINPKGASFLGVKSVTAVKGVANFSRLEIGKSGASFTIIASSPGLASATSKPIVVTPSNASLTLGLNHTCAILDGSAKCWGENTFGQLGNATLSSTCTADAGGTTLSVRCAKIPTQVDGLTSRVTSISAGTNHTCAIKNGGAWCWGVNDWGQLGDGTLIDRRSPVPVYGLSSKVVAISAGDFHTCAVLTTGRITCWGLNSTGQLGVPAILKADGSVNRYGDLYVSDMFTSWSTPMGEKRVTDAHFTLDLWGSDLYDYLSVSAKDTDILLGQFSSVPVLVGGILSGASAIAAGTYHTCAIVKGASKCWGANFSGQLGVGSIMDVVNPDFTGAALFARTPSQVSLLKFIKYNQYYFDQQWNGPVNPSPSSVYGLSAGTTSIAAAGDHTCATVNGKVKCWGSNFVYQLGNSSITSPCHIDLTNTEALSQGLLASSGLMEVNGNYIQTANGNLDAAIAGLVPGTVYDMTDVNGVLNGIQPAFLPGMSSINPCSTEPIGVTGISSGASLVQVSGGSSCSVVNGGAYCWGENQLGQLGDGATPSVNQPVPRQVFNLPQGSGVRMVVPSVHHSCAIYDSGKITCWGMNDTGELGNGTQNDSLRPVLVTGS
jgi:alpha-tubulin suppressor-like RCC1 family protein